MDTSTPMRTPADAASAAFAAANRHDERRV